MGSENGGQLDLRIIAHILLDIEFYNEASDQLMYKGGCCDLFRLHFLSGQNSWRSS